MRNLTNAVIFIDTPTELFSPLSTTLRPPERDLSAGALRSQRGTNPLPARSRPESQQIATV
jgi:hypothetical protein